GPKSSLPVNHGMTWWMPLLSTSSGRWLWSSRTWSLTASVTMTALLWACGKRSWNATGTRRRSTAAARATGRSTRGQGRRPAGGEPALQADRRRILRGAPLEEQSQLALHEIGLRALDAAVDVTAHLGGDVAPELAALKVKQVIAHIVAVHTLSYRFQSLRSTRSAARARESRDFTVPTAQPSTCATSTSVRPSRSRRITVRASSASIMSARSISSAMTLRSRSSSTSSLARPTSGGPDPMDATVSRPPTIGLPRWRRYWLMNVLRRIRKSHALRLVPGVNCAALPRAWLYVSWTRSSASVSLPVR